MSLTVLDRALIIAQHELEAMRRGDVESVATFFSERGKLLDKAVHSNDEQNVDDFRLKLLALQGYHQIIHEEGMALLNQYRNSLIKSKKQSRMAKSYIKQR